MEGTSGDTETGTDGNERDTRINREVDTELHGDRGPVWTAEPFHKSAVVKTH